ncbi:MAG: ankyrin repeat domain-containing protein, partial [Rubrivivax sp.]
MRNYFKKVIYLLAVVSVSTAMAGSYEDFFKAVNRDDGDTVATLVQRGFDPNSRDPQGQTALHLALRDQSPRTANALWRSTELDVNALNAAGETPLMLAALKGELDWAQRLLTRGARLH